MLESPAIRTQELTKQFGEQLAVDHLTFTVPWGVIFGFIGPSGSGKTTTIRLLTGLTKPTSGKVTVLGATPAEFTQKMRARLGHMPQHFVLYQDLSIWENLNFAASLYGLSRHERKRLDGLLEFVELREHKRKLVRNISGGMQRRLSLAATLAHEPELVFLDEPTAGVDPILRRKFWTRFETLKEEGRTLFITTQYVSEAAYCDFVGVIAEGRLLAVDTPQALRRRAYGGEIVDLYTAEYLEARHLARLRAHPLIKSLQPLGSKGWRAVVDDSGTAMPQLMKWSQEQNLTLESIEEYLPPFDDVFVELVSNGKPNASLG